MMIRNDIFTTGGTVQAGEGLYIERQADQEILELCRSSTYAYVLTARQMGKSSMMVRTADCLSQEGICSVILDLTELGAQASADAWYMGLFFRICTRLGLKVKFGAWWHAHLELGLTQRLVLFFQEVVLAEVTGQIVVFLDEIDITLAMDFTDDFFTAIRFLYNARAQSEELRRLSFVLIGVATPGELIADPKRTPFNIGQRVDLTDFTFSEAEPLAQGLPLASDEAHQALGWVFKWTRGHPYLTQVLCARIAGQGPRDWTEGEVDQVVAGTFFGVARERDDNLQFVHDIVTRRSPDRTAILQAYQEILTSRRPVLDSVQSAAKAHLKLSGLVKREGKTLQVRNPIYERVFDRKWIQTQWPVTWWQLLPRSVKISVVLIACLFVALVLTSIFALKQNQTVHAQADEAEQAALLNRNIALAAQSQIARQTQDLDLALALALEAVGVDSPINQAQLALSEAAYAPGTVRIFQAPHPSTSLAVSPDGRYLLTGDSYDAEGPDLGIYLLRLWDIQTGKEMRTFEGVRTGENRQAAFTPDGRFALSAAYDTRLILWDVATGKPVYYLTGHQEPAQLFDISPNGRMALSGATDGSLILWDLETGKEIRRFMSSSEITGIAFTPDSRQALTTNLMGELVLWDVESGQIAQGPNGKESVHNLTSSPLSVALNLDISPDGRFAVLPDGSEFRVRLLVWDLQAWKAVRKIGPVTTSYKVSVQISPDGRQVVSNDQNGIKIWDTETGSLLQYFAGHKGGAYNQTYSPDGKYIFSVSSADKLVRMWSLESGAVLHRYPYKNEARSVAYSPDGRFALTADLDEVSYWDVKTGQAAWRFPSASTIALDLTFAPDGKTAFAAMVNVPPAAVQLNLETGKQEVILGNNNDGPYSGGKIAIAPDGLTAVTTGYDPPLILWDLKTSSKIRSFLYHPLSRDPNIWAGGISISPDGRSALSGGVSVISLWNLENGVETRRFEGHTNLVWETAFLPDGRRALSASSDHTLILWDVETGEMLQQFLGHTTRVNAFDISPNGKTALSASDDGTLILWDLASGQAVRRYYGHQGAVKDVDISPDGLTALSAGVDGTVIEWRIDRNLSDLMAWVKANRYMRELTCMERALFAVEPLCKEKGKVK